MNSSKNTPLRLAISKLLLLALLFMGQQSHAQFVTIPDPAFAAFLQSNYSAAMTGNQLNTQHPSVTGATSMVISGTQFGDFEGLQYFSNLQYLDMSGDFFGVPQVSSLVNLTYIRITGNILITAFPNLPSGVLDMASFNCPFLSSVSFPNALTTASFLDCSSLSSLPSFPAGLKNLYFQNCTALSLLPSIPASLELLNCESTPAINSINLAATNLVSLYCRNNSLTTLQTLPATLTFLDCSNNNLSALGTLPNGFIYLDCSFNNITCLPVLPSGFAQLIAANNPVNCLPNIPSSLIASDIGFGLCNNLSVSTSAVLCNGECNGEATASLNAGACYDLLWSNGVSQLCLSTSSPSYTSFCAGNYTVYVTPSSGNCPSQATFNVTEPLAIVTTSIVTDVTMPGPGGNNGSIQLNASGGIGAPYEYSIDSGATFSSSNLFNNLTAGIYFTAVRDANACTFFRTDTVNQTPSAFVLIPDAAFVTFLNSNFPNAMSGNLMDTSHVDIINDTILGIPNLGIANFYGLQFFTMLEELYITGNNLSGFSLPPFNNLQVLGITDCPSITAFPVVSSPVIYTQYCFTCTGLTSAPPIQPSTKIYNFINCPNLNALPPLPSGLVVLDLTGSSIDVLPAIGDTLQILHVDSNQNIQFSFAGLTQNSQMHTFSCENAGLFDLPDLTNYKGTSLVCRNNLITCLPKLPETIQNIAASGNLITCLPNIPSSLSSSDVGFTTCVNNSSGGTVNATCSGICNGQATVNTTVGINYQYSWSNGQFNSGTSGTSTVTNLCGGSITVEMNDGIGCSSYRSFFINQNATLNAFAAITNITCGGSNDGALNIIATGGTTPYLYSIDGGITFQSSSVFSNLSAGTYSVLVKDAVNCSATTTATITEPTPLTIGMITNLIVCNNDSVQICIPLVSGGISPYAYSWSTGSFANCTYIPGPGNYTITVTDINGCTISTGFSVIYSPGWQAPYVDTLALPTCGVCNGYANISLSGGNPPFAYQWTNSGITTPYNSSICENTINEVIITDASGCLDTITFTLSCTSVWPGDANYDGVADNTDLLAIGVGYGATGEPRVNPSILWQAQEGVDWNDTLTGSINYKHIDCNGDGSIDDWDTTAIIQNFSLTHPLRPFSAAGPNDPSLYFEIQVDTTGASTQLFIPLVLGTAQLPANDVYGIAFTVSYDTALVKADSVTMDFTNCWMAGNNNRISIAVNDPLNGLLYGAVSRINHTDTSGFGTISTLGIVTVDNISARLSLVISDTLILNLSNVTLINYNGENKNINVISDSIVVNDYSTGINSANEKNEINIYPNPARDFFIISFEKELSAPEIVVYSTLNEEMKVNYNAGKFNAVVNCSELDAGIYIVKVKHNDGIITRKIKVE
jgi:Secretion system C-terminal sorting domain/SprB repeat